MPAVRLPSKAWWTASWSHPPAETFTWEADMVLKAIGQTLGNPVLGQAG
jgi:hypothetical protein